MYRLPCWSAFCLLIAFAVTGACAPRPQTISCPPSPAASSCLQKALDALPETGGVVALAEGVYVLDIPIQIRRDGVTLQGTGPRTVLRRQAETADGEGALNLRAAKITLRQFYFDGAVLQSKGIAYADPAGGMSVHGAPIHGDPMHPELLRNTSITIHGGASDIQIEDVEMRHTGGYAILIDARYASIAKVEMRRLTLRENRPHLFGTSGDFGYGSWTGGIHYQNDGRDLPFARHALRGLSIEDSVFERITGHAIWGHGYGFQTMNEDVVVRRNRFTDIGMDAVLIGNVRRATVEDNEFHRIGFVALQGDLPTHPAWYPGLRPDGSDNIPAVGIDTSGLVSDSVYRRNTMWNVNGHCIDLDGFTRGEVVHNTMRVSGREDAWNYVNDEVEQFGARGVGNITKGINLSNTSASEATEGVRIADNTLVNLGGLGIVLNDAQRCIVEDNHIRHYSVLYVPIVITNSLREPRAQHESKGNIIRNNYIHFHLEGFCIAEVDDFGGGPLPVVGPNEVRGNTCDANTHGEFLPGRASKSRAAGTEQVSSPH